MPEPWVGAGGTIFGIVGVILITSVILALYFMPWLIALGRNSKNASGIFVLNLLLGWTLLAWVVCFVWAFVGEITETFVPGPVSIPSEKNSKQSVKSSKVSLTLNIFFGTLLALYLIYPSLVL